MPRLTSLVASTTHVLDGAHPNPRGYLIPEANWGLTRNPPRGTPFLYLVFFFFLLVSCFFFFLFFILFLLLFLLAHLPWAYPVAREHRTWTWPVLDLADTCPGTCNPSGTTGGCAAQGLSPRGHDPDDTASTSHPIAGCHV